MPPVLGAVAAAGATKAVTGLAVLGTGALVRSKIKSDKKKAQAAEDAARETARLQQEQIAKLEAQQQEEIAGEESRRVRDSARQRQKQRAVGARGRRSTILTTPLGDVGEASTQRTTLIAGGA